MVEDSGRVGAVEEAAAAGTTFSLMLGGAADLEVSMEVLEGLMRDSEADINSITSRSSSSNTSTYSRTRTFSS